jgi:hypothetical protein
MNALKAVDGASGEVMFPDADDAPASLSQPRSLCG